MEMSNTHNHFYCYPIRYGTGETIHSTKAPKWVRKSIKETDTRKQNGKHQKAVRQRETEEKKKNTQNVHTQKKKTNQAKPKRGNKNVYMD